VIETIRALVRPVVTLALTAAVIGLTFLGKLPPEILAASASTAFGFYFADRAAQKNQQQPR